MKKKKKNSIFILILHTIDKKHISNRYTKTEKNNI